MATTRSAKSTLITTRGDTLAVSHETVKPAWRVNGETPRPATPSGAQPLEPHGKPVQHRDGRRAVKQKGKGARK